MSDPGAFPVPARGTSSPQVSILIPVYNEEPNIAPLVDAVRTAMGSGPDWELLLVDDGSTDGTVDRIRAAAAADPRIRLIPLARNYGQTTALQAGFDHVRGAVVVTLDGDLQNDPADIPLLLAMLDEGYDLVAGYRLRRQDPLWNRRLPSVIANRIIQWVTQVPIRDNGCSLKAYRRDLIDRLTLYADLHRFIPAVAAATAGARIAEIPVRHHPRRQGRSKYGIGRVWKVLADLFTIGMIRSFRERPLVLFALAGSVAALLAVLTGGLAMVLQMRDPDSVKFVLSGAAMLWVALACYLVMLGLLAEAAVRERRSIVRELAPLARTAR